MEFAVCIFSALRPPETLYRIIYAEIVRFRKSDAESLSALDQEKLFIYSACTLKKPQLQADSSFGSSY